MRVLPAFAVLALLLLPTGIASTDTTFDLVAVLGVGPLGPRFGEESSPASTLPPGTYHFQAAVPVPCNGETVNVILTPRSGVWVIPVHVIANYETQPDLQDHTGRAGPLHLRAHCEGQELRSDDLLVLIMGQFGLTIVASVTLKVGGTVFHDTDVFLG